MTTCFKKIAKNLTTKSSQHRIPSFSLFFLPSSGKLFHIIKKSHNSFSYHKNRAKFSILSFLVGTRLFFLFRFFQFTVFSSPVALSFHPPWKVKLVYFFLPFSIDSKMFKIFRNITCKFIIFNILNIYLSGEWEGESDYSRIRLEKAYHLKVMFESM